MTTRRRIEILIGILLSLGMGLMPLGIWGRAYSGLGKLLGSELLWWIAAVAILSYVALAERLPFSSIGFRTPGIRDLLFATSAGVLLVVGMIAIYGFVFPLLHLKINTGELSLLKQTPLWYRFLLVTRAAVVEEILFRGYPIERLETLTNSRAIAALLPWAAFTYAHLSSWGGPQLIVAGYGGAILTALYFWRRNLWANMLAHWIADGAGFLLALR